MVHMLRSCRCRRGAKQLCTRVACVFFLALLGLQAAYAASYIGNVYSELDLNTHLQQAAVVNSNIKLVFKNAGDVYTLNAVYTILYTVQLDASSLRGGVRLRAAKGQHHFSVEQNAIYRGNLTAINIHFENAYRSSYASTVYGGSLVVNGDLTTYNCTFVNNTAANSEARGGAIAASLQANVQLYNTRFYGNVASAHGSAAAGGALYADLDSSGKVLIDGCDFEGNRAMIRPSNVSGAYATGGALDITGGSVRVLNSRFSRNVVEVSRGAAAGGFYGGAVSFRSVSRCQFNSTQFTSNQLAINSTGSSYASPASAYGGALYTSESSCDLWSVTFSSNIIKQLSRVGAGYILGYGGAACFDATLEARQVLLMSCVFLANGMSISGGGYGGAVGATEKVHLSMSLSVAGKPLLFSGNWVNITGWSDNAYSAYGGALYYQGPGLDVSNATFRDNSALVIATGAANIWAFGGAVSASSTTSGGRFRFQSTVFLRNRGSADVRSAAAATKTAEAWGGGLFVGSAGSTSLNLTGCSFTLNSAYVKGTSLATTHVVYGGAMVLYGPSLSTEIYGGAFVQNSCNSTTLSYGGAVYINFAKNTTFRQTDFRRNYVALVGSTGNGKAHGAALYAARTSVLLDSCTLVSNQALNSGYNAFSFGAVYAMEVYRLKLFACTLLDNNAAKGQSPGALYAYGWPNGVSAISQVSIKACTIQGPETNTMGFAERVAVDCTDTTSSGGVTVASWSGAAPVCYAPPTKAPTAGAAVTTTAPTQAPTTATSSPTRLPTRWPTTSPTPAPTHAPTTAPTRAPTTLPSSATESPTRLPTTWPTVSPSLAPTQAPTTALTLTPSRGPTELPSPSPTPQPSPGPFLSIPAVPTVTELLAPSSSEAPSIAPVTMAPSTRPTLLPTIVPTPLATDRPSMSPTVLPSRIPTTSPSMAPTLVILNPMYSIQLRSIHHVRGKQIVVNKQDLSLQVLPSIARSDGAAVWRSANSSLLRPIGEGGGLLTPSLATSFLVISGAALVEGSTYVISVSSTGSSVDNQVTLIVNEAPRGGSLTISPMNGQALLTTFTATCGAWMDADLPLSYQYSAQMPGSPQPTLLPLAGPTDQFSLQTTLPPSSNVTFRVNVMDALGASTLATRTSISVTRLANASKALSVLSSLELQVNASGSSSTLIRLDNSSATRLVSMLGVVTRALTELPEPIAPAVETRILQLMNASLQAISLDLSRAEALGGVLQALSTQEVVESEASGLLELATTFTAQVQEQVGLISPVLTLSVLDTIDGAIRFRNALTPVTEGVGPQTNHSLVVNATSPSACALVDQCSQRMDKILDCVHGLVANQLSPGQAAVEHTTPSLTLASQAQTLETLEVEGGLQLDSPSKTGIRFRLNSTALGSKSFQSLLPNQTVTIKKVDWANNRRPCAGINNLLGSTDDSPVVTAGISQIDIVLPQTDSAMKLSSLTPPLEISTSYPATVTNTISCPRGKRITKEVRCPGPGDTVVSVECDGQVESVTAVCPAPMPACVFWNETEKAWSKAGVTTRGFKDGQLICESTHASEFAVIKFTGGQLWMLSEMLKNPELVLKDRSVMVAMGAMYIIFLIAFLISRHKKQRDSKQFADGVICHPFYDDAAACLASLEKARIPNKTFGSGGHFSRTRPLSRPLDSVVNELTGRRIAALQTGRRTLTKRGQVSNELLSYSLTAQLGPTWQQRQLWLFLRCLTIVFLCALLHGSTSNRFIVALINADNITYDMVMGQLSIAFQGALIAFPPSMLVQVLTNIINRKAREDLQLEGELDFPFYIPSSGEVLDQGTYFCALRVAIKHLELTRRAIVYDIRAKYQADHQVDHKRIRMVVNAGKAVLELKERYFRELSRSFRKDNVSSFLLSWLVPCLPIEVTGRLSIVQECDVEKIIEVEYDQWVANKLDEHGRLGPLLSWYYLSWIAPPVLKGPGSSGLPWGYMLSYLCLVVYALVLTFSTMILSVGYTSSDALAVLFGCLLTFATDLVTMSSLQYGLQLLGMILSRQLIEHIFVVRRPFLDHVTNYRDAVTGARISADGGPSPAEERKKMKLSFEQSKKVLVVTSKGAKGGDPDDTDSHFEAPWVSLPPELSKDPLQPVSPISGATRRSLVGSPKATSYKAPPSITTDPEEKPDDGLTYNRRTSTRRASAAGSPRTYRASFTVGEGAADEQAMSNANGEAHGFTSDPDAQPDSGVSYNRRTSTRRASAASPKTYRASMTARDGTEDEQAMSNANGEAHGFTSDPEAQPDGGVPYKHRSSARRASAAASPKNYRVGIVLEEGAEGENFDEKRRRQKSERSISPPPIAEHDLSDKTGRRQSRRIDGDEEGAEGLPSHMTRIGSSKTWHAKRKSSCRVVPQEGHNTEGLDKQEAGADTFAADNDLEPEVLTDWQLADEDAPGQELFDGDGVEAETRRERARRRTPRSSGIREARRSSKSHR